MTARRIVTLIGPVTIACGLLWSARAWADAADYSPDNAEWQGITRLVQIANEMGYAVDARTKLDWSTLKQRDILLFVYPTAEIPRKKLVAFLRGGGRMILADDFGSSQNLLEKLGVKRVPVAGQRVSRLHAENPALPIATPGVSHPLNTGITEIVTNHPSAFDTTLPAIFRFEPASGALVVAATLGKGRVVLLSDPSILINRMLKFPGNDAFARRLLGYFGRAGEDRYVLLVQSFEETGTPRASVKVTSPPPEGLSAILADANNLLSEFNEYLLERLWIMPIATLLAGLLLGLAVWVMPMVRPRYDASWTRPGEGPPAARYERDLAPYLNDRPGKLNFIYPAAVLRDVLDVDLETVLGITAPLLTMDEHALRKVIRQQAGGVAEHACGQLVQLTRRIPTRDQVTPYTLTPRFSFRDLQRLQDIGAEILGAIQARSKTAGRA